MSVRKRERSSVQCFTDIFNCLRDFCVSKSITYPLHQRHCIDTSEQEDETIENLKILDTHRFGSNTILVIFQINDKKYAANCGISVLADEYFGQHFESIEIWAGAWTALTKELELPVKENASATEIYDKILSVPIETDPKKVCPVNFWLLEEVFPKISVYSIVSDSPFFESTAAQVLGYLMCCTATTARRISEISQNEFKLTFESSSKHIPYDLLITAYNSSQKKHAFVELYRCLEKLYPVPATRTLKSSLGFDQGCPLSFAKVIEECIGWRPKEDDSLEKIILELDPSTISAIESAKKKVPEYKDFKVHNFIYKLRNAHVHYRPSLKEPEISGEAWDEIIAACLIVIQDIYKKYDDALTI